MNKIDLHLFESKKTYFIIDVCNMHRIRLVVRFFQVFFLIKLVRNKSNRSTSSVKTKYKKNKTENIYFYRQYDIKKPIYLYIYLCTITFNSNHYSQVIYCPAILYTYLFHKFPDNKQ